jgi:pimeloyl-ACP methyl ester carboxylesterase
MPPLVWPPDRDWDTEFVTAVSLYTRHWGPESGTPRILLLHGLTSAGRVWWQVAEALASHGWSVTAPDLRGHGRSPRAQSYLFAELTDDVLALGGGWDLVVGHSLGGAVSVLALQRDADFAARAVLIDPALRNDPAAVPAFLRSVLKQIADPDAQAYRAAHPSWPERTINTWVASQHEVDAEAVRAILETNRPWDVTAAALELSRPVHVLAADPALGPSFTAVEGDALMLANPNWSYEIVAGASHSVHRDQPQLVIDRLLASGG